MLPTEELDTWNDEDDEEVLVDLPDAPARKISVRRRLSPVEALKQHWGYDGFRELQGEAVQGVVERKDVLVILPTGGGKSLCYQVPAACGLGLVLVVSPLIALMDDQVAGARGLACGPELYTATPTRPKNDACGMPSTAMNWTCSTSALNGCRSVTSSVAMPIVWPWWPSMRPTVSPIGAMISGLNTAPLASCSTRFPTCPAWA